MTNSKTERLPETTVLPKSKTIGSAKSDKSTKSTTVSTATAQPKTIEIPFQAKLKALVTTYLDRTVKAVLLFIAVLLSLKDCSRLINTYVQQDFVSSVTTMQNDTLQLPNPTICIEFSAADLDSGTRYDMFNPLSVKAMLEKYEEHILLLVTSVSDKVDKEPEPRVQRLYLQYFNHPDRPILKPILYLLANVISAAVGLETNHYEKFISDFDWNYRFDPDSATGVIPSESLAQAYNFFSYHQIDFSDVVKTVGAYLCVLSELSTYQYSEINMRQLDFKANLCRKEYVTWVGPKLRTELTYELNDYLCLRPPAKLKLFQFNQSTSGVNLILKPQNFFLRTNKTTSYWAQFKLHLDFKRDPTVMSFDNVVSLKYFEWDRMKVAVEDEFTQLNTPTRPCSNEPAKTVECPLVCQANVVSHNCGCAPLFSQTFAPCAYEIPKKQTNPKMRKNVAPDQCSLSCKSKLTTGQLSNTQCYNSVAKGITEAYRSCKKSCLKSCSYQTLTFTKGTSVLAKNNNLITGVAFLPLRFSYAIVREKQLIEESQLAAQLGGVACLYLLVANLVARGLVVIFQRLTKVKVQSGKVGPQLREMMIVKAAETLELQHQKLEEENNHKQEIEKTKVTLKSISDQFTANKMTIWAHIAKVENEVKSLKADLDTYKKKSWGQIASLQNNVDFHLTTRQEKQ